MGVSGQLKEIENLKGVGGVLGEMGVCQTCGHVEMVFEQVLEWDLGEQGLAECAEVGDIPLQAIFVRSSRSRERLRLPINIHHRVTRNLPHIPRIDKPNLRILINCI